MVFSERAAGWSGAYLRTLFSISTKFMPLSYELSILIHLNPVCLRILISSLPMGKIEVSGKSAALALALQRKARTQATGENRENVYHLSCFVVV